MSPLEQNAKELADSILQWYIVKVNKDYHLKDIYNQLLRSATSIGTNIAEAKFVRNDADYKNKLGIALKEAIETNFWIERLVKIDSIDSELEEYLQSKTTNIIRILRRTLTIQNNRYYSNFNFFM